jgi:hypothetical protein
MGNENINEEFSGITFEEAKKRIADMTLVNNFLFNSVMENPEIAKEVSQIVISTVVGHKVIIQDAVGEKVLTGLDNGLHGVRFDALIGVDDSDEDCKCSRVAYDFEVEDRKADKTGIPRRQRYYSSMIDSKLLESSLKYEELPQYVSITVFSYDPFGADDMYYEAKTVLTSHPDLCYDDGRTNYFFYGKGKNNLPTEKFNKKAVADLMKYIVTGEKSDESNDAVGMLDDIVLNVKKKSEVTRSYMKEWDRQRIHDIELTEQVTEQVTQQVTQKVSSEIQDVYKWLYDNGRVDDIGKATTDNTYYQKVLLEYKEKAAVELHS